MKNKLTHDGTVYGFKIKEAFMRLLKIEMFADYDRGLINVYIDGDFREKITIENAEAIGNDFLNTAQDLRIEHERIANKCAH